MPDRFWVGGTANWDGTAGTKWAATSGGAGGQSVPTSADDVFFDAASGTVTVTVAATGNCRNLNLTGFTGVIAGTQTINIFGNLTLSSVAVTNTYTGSLIFNSGAAQTITSNGRPSLGGVLIAAGSSVSLNDAFFSASSAINLLSGTFTTNNYTVGAASLTSTGTNTRTFNLGSSTVTLSSIFTPIDLASTGLTFNAGTSTINLSGPAISLSGAGFTFHDVAFTSTAITTVSISGANTFNNLTVAARAGFGLSTVSLVNNQVINGTLTLSAGANATIRTFVRASTIGATRTLTCAAVASLTDIDFRDITIAGAAAPVSGTRLGDCKGNSGITFPAGTSKFWNLAAGGNWATAVGWATSGGGTPAINNLPLAQDTAVFQATGLGNGAIITITQPINIGTVDMSARTSNTMQIAFATAAVAVYGDILAGTGATITYSTSCTVTLAGRTVQTLVCTTLLQLGVGFVIFSPGGTFQLGSNLNMGSSFSGNITLTTGTFKTNGYAATLQRFISSTTAFRTLDISGSTITMDSGSSGTVWDTATATNLTVIGPATIDLTNASAKTFAGGGANYSGVTLNQGGSGTLTITGSNRFANITNSVVATVLFAGGSTNEFTNFNLNGVSTLSRLTLGSTNTTQAILRKPTAWNVGTGSLDSGNNTGLSFTAGTNDFLNISYINGQVINVVLASVAETATGTDTISARALFAPRVNETATGTDTILARARFASRVNETATGTDTILARARFASRVNETATGTDTILARARFAPRVTETATGTDTILARARFSPRVVETATGTDAVLARARFSPRVVETAALSDFARGNFSYFATVVENAAITDVAVGSSLWTLIVNSQVPNWQSTSNTQIPVWSSIDDSQNPNWQNTPT